MTRTPVIAANWKMYKKRAEGVRTARELVELLEGVTGVEVVVCPPFTALSAVREAIEGSPLRLGGQDMHWEAEGAFTGEISGEMLLDCGCRYVILGHSERRRYFQETDQSVSRKLRKALTLELEPIVCVGETLEEREAGRVEEVVLGQLERGLDRLTGPDLSRIIIAYEPVWAIGTGKTATPQAAQEVHSLIRGWFREKGAEEISDSVRILYGGSVKPQNSAELMGQPDIDGALVGGAGLDAVSFAGIVKY